ncbi:MAG TPA: transposase [Steroidobacteraceae bacterium]|nr:transposase [Steroidobacteraceae bacterium]
MSLRGNHREDLFSSPQDRAVLNGFVADAIDEYKARIHAFCWMTTHLHAFFQIGEAKLGKLVQHFAKRYSRYRHKQLRTTGQLYDGPHRPFLVDSDTYFLALLRYIHLNPVSARMVSSPDDYPNSSHNAYRGVETLPWLTTDVGLSLLSKTIGGAHATYDALIRGDLGVDPGFKLVASDDPRVIGTDRSLASLPPPRIKPRSRLTLEQMAFEVCAEFGISLEEIRAPSRHRRLSPGRAHGILSAGARNPECPAPTTLSWVPVGTQGIPNCHTYVWSRADALRWAEHVAQA